MQSIHRLDKSLPIFSKLENMRKVDNAEVWLHVRSWVRKTWVAKTIILSYEPDTNETQYTCKLFTSDYDDNTVELNTYETVRITDTNYIYRID